MTDQKPIEPCDDNTLENRWVEFNEECTKEESRKSSFQKKIILSLSVAIIGLIGCFGYIHLFQSSSIDSIYNKHYERYDAASSFNSTHVKAINNYHKGNSKEAIKLFNTIPKTDSLNMGCSNFYLALSYIDCNNLKEATTLLENITQSASIYYHPANWYLGLSYIKMYKIEEARFVLKKIIDSDSPYKEEAYEVLGLLEKVNE